MTHEPSRISVHRTGFNNLFWGSYTGKLCWVPTRNLATRYFTAAIAAKALQAAIASFSSKPGAVVLDLWEHPEIEVALKACRAGDLGELPVLRAYQERAGFASLLHFGQRVIGPDFSQVYRTWDEG